MKKLLQYLMDLWFGWSLINVVCMFLWEKLEYVFFIAYSCHCVTETIIALEIVSVVGKSCDYFLETKKVYQIILGCFEQ